MEIHETGAQQTPRRTSPDAGSCVHAGNDEADEASSVTSDIVGKSMPERPDEDASLPSNGPPRAAPRPNSSESEIVSTSKQVRKRAPRNLVTQSIDQFIITCENELQNLRPVPTPERYKDLSESLLSPPSAGGMWSDGKEWSHLLDEGRSVAKVGTFYYAMSALTFARWHESQALLEIKPDENPEKARKKANQIVSGRLLGPKPEESQQMERWQARRKKLNTELARGRKCSRLAEKLGYGITIVNTWELAKTKELNLDSLVSNLLACPEKMTVLQIVESQVFRFLQSGTTDLERFRHDLEEKGLWSSSLESQAPRPSNNLAVFSRSITKINTTDILYPGTELVIPSESLRALKTTPWHRNIVLTCLYLADKFTFIRVSPSVTVLGQTCTRKNLFEQAATQLAEWHRTAEEPLICLFVLARQTQYSLLEINEVDGSIYHYDLTDKYQDAEGIKVCSDHS
ncbi:hypothetical protein ACJ41O_006483 [Fusarium nematophilum]